jgi:FKBP-type peptidyl-prolyl cis-trans isomerase
MNRRNFVVLTGALVLAACGPSKKASAAAELDAGKAFLAANAKAPGVKVLPSGLQYKIVRSGPADGMRPQKQDEVKVNYEGKLLNGKIFDSSYERGVPAAMPVDALIPAWVEALQLMRPGDEWMLYAPSNLAYGDGGQGEIPPGSTLIFRIELIAVLPGPGHTANG